MRQGVKFQNIAPVNGRVMDIDDWKTSHERHIATGVYRTALADAGLDKVEFTDNRTMVFKFKAPFVPMVDRAWDSTFMYFIMPKELNADPKIAEKTAIGTGYKSLTSTSPRLRSSTENIPATGAATRSSSAGTSRSFRSTPTATPSSSRVTSPTSGPPPVT